MNFSCPYFAHLYSYEFFVVTLLRKNQASFCFCVLCEQNFRSNGSNQFYDVQATKIWKSYNQKMFSKDRMIKFHAWKKDQILLIFSLVNLFHHQLTIRGILWIQGPHLWYCCHYCGCIHVVGADWQNVC